jgi:hypothetical protein
MDQKTPHNSTGLHLLPPVAGHLTLERVDLRSIVLPVAAMNHFPLWGVSETGSDDRIRRLPNVRSKRCEDVEVLLVPWRCELGLSLQMCQPGMHGPLPYEGV